MIANRLPDQIALLKAANSQLTAYARQLESQIVALTREKSALEVQLNAHIDIWQRQTGYKFMGFNECATLYQKNWTDDDRIVMFCKYKHKLLPKE